MSAATRVLRHESELGTWELVDARARATPPRARLRLPGVRRERRPERRCCASRCRRPRLPLIVNFGAPWNVADAEHGEPRAHDSFVAGLGERSSYVAATGPASCVQVNLTPLGAHMFFGLPMHELANRVVVLEDVLPRHGRGLARAARGCAELGRAVRRSSTPLFAARLAEAQRAVRRRRLGVAHRSSARTARRRSAGSATGSAAAAGISRRGSASRSGSRRRPSRGSSASTVPSHCSDADGAELADVAFECGYYDQAHLNRDFREFAGTPPGGVRAPDRPGRRRRRLELGHIRPRRRCARRVVLSEHHERRTDELHRLPELRRRARGARLARAGASASSARRCTRARTARSRTPSCASATG